jgi:HEAT repeat protein
VVLPWIGPAAAPAVEELAQKLPFTSVAEGHLAWIAYETGGGGEKCVERLKELALNEDEREAHLRELAVTALGRMQAERERVLDILIHIHDTGGPKLRRAAARAMGSLGIAEPAVVDRLLGSARSNDSELRVAALDALGRLGVKTEETVSLAMNFANSEQRGIRLAGLRALGRLGVDSREAMDRLLGATSSEDYLVQQHALRALGRIRAEPERVVPLVAEYVLCDNKVLQKAAIEALGRYGPDAASALPRLKTLLLRERDLELVIAGLDAVAQIGSPAASLVLFLKELPDRRLGKGPRWLYEWPAGDYARLRLEHAVERALQQIKGAA